MPEQPILVKVLLRERHWQHYATFCAEYDKAAVRVDPDLVHSYPSRAQLHRWLSGSLRGLPYPDHCRVLEEMFPGWTAEQLFQPVTPELLYTSTRQPGLGTPPRPDLAGPPVFAVPSVGIRPFIEQAFTSEHVTIDFAGFSGETLHGVIQEPLDKIRIGRIKPATLAIRLLLPDTTRPLALPCRADDLSDDPDFRARSHQRTARHAHAILDTVHELASLGLIEHATAEIRVHSCPPLFKLYVLNTRDVFFGFYPIVKHSVELPGGARDIYDPMGKDALVFHHSADSGQPGDAPYVEQAKTWFDSMWQSISYEFPRMTSDQDHGNPASILGLAWHLLLDFDGPICDVYAGLPAATVADRLRKYLQGQDVTVPDEVTRTDDPLDVFAYAATISPTLAAEVEAEMTDLEVTAVATAKPTAYLHEVLAACRETGRTVAVVSNNSARAVHTYLTQHGLDDRISHVIARTSNDPTLLKPSPHLIKQALTALNAQPDACALIGDSTTDIQGAHLAGIASIGYANEPSKRKQLYIAGADTVITSLADLVLGLRIRPLLN